MVNIIKAYDIIKLLKQVSSAGAMVSRGNFIALPVTLVAALNKAIDSHDSELLQSVRAREGCPHIKIKDINSPLGSPTASAAQYVAEFGGVAWMVGNYPLYFYHPNRCFKPLLFSRLIANSSGKLITIKSDLEFRQKITLRRSGEKYGCLECDESRRKRNM